MERKITRTEVCARCEKAAEAAERAKISEPNDDVKKAFLQAIDGWTEYLMRNLNPIANFEHAFLIFALRTVEKAISEEDPRAAMIATMLGGIIQLKHYKTEESSILAAARRAMMGHGENKE